MVKRSSNGNWGVFLVSLFITITVLFSFWSPVAAQEVQKGGQLVIGWAWEPDPVLDPYQLGWGNLPLDLFEGLLTATFDFEPGPGIADSWEFKEDGLVQIYHIRPDKYFHDGTRVDAHSLKEYYKYLISDEVDCPSRFDFAFISEIEVVDDFTLKFILDQPFPAALSNLAWGGGFGGIQSVEAWKEYGPWGTNEYGTTVAVGTGPFQFVEWVPGDRIVLERFDDYRSPPIFDNPGPAHLDGVTYRILPDAATRIMEFEVGNVHILEDVPPEFAHRIMEMDNAELYEEGSWEVVYLGFACDREPFDNVLVRQAINAAIDQDELVDVVWLGWAEPAYAYVAPLFGENHVPSDEYFGYDLDGAKALLAEAGYPDGFSTVLAVEHRTDFVAAAEIVQDMLRDVGIEVEILQYDRAGFYEHLRLAEQEMFIRAHSWHGLDIMPWYFHSRNFPYPNYHRYVDEELDAMFDAADYAENYDLLASRYRDIQRYLAELALWAPLAHPSNLRAVRSELQNYKNHPMYGIRYNVDTWLQLD